MLSEKRKRHLEKLNSLPQTIANRFKKHQRPWNYGLRKYVNRKCLFCGKEFKAALREVERGRGKYCSRECMYAAKRESSKRRKVYELYMQGLTYKEIGEKLGMSSQAVGHYVYIQKICNRFGNGIIDPATKGRLKNLLKQQGIDKCELCGYDRVLDIAHVIPKVKGGKLLLNNVLLLCPNCHRLFDCNLLTEDEKEKLLSIERVKESLKRRWDEVAK